MKYHDYECGGVKMNIMAAYADLFEQFDSNARSQL